MRVPELSDDLLSPAVPTEKANKDAACSGRIRVEYLPLDAAVPEQMLAAIRFGTDATSMQPPPAALCIDVQLKPLTGVNAIECWHANGPVTQGQLGSIRFASDGWHLFAVSELEERECGGVRATAETIYREMQHFQRRSGFPHLLRMWNCVDAINGGEGDQERYRQFCVGRLQGLDDTHESRFPAASAIGHQHATHRLQVYWLASRAPGTHIENPRQVSAYRYPRAHGPVSPSFARATLNCDGALLVSGTASIVGHLSQHVGDPLAQLDEILRNLATLSAAARRDGTEAKSTLSADRSLLKLYVRNPADVTAIENRIRAAFPRCSMLFLAADICRRELLLEIELVRLAADWASTK